MKKALQKAGNVLDRIQKVDLTFCGILLLAMCLIIPVQVFFRYVLGASLAWSEELTRYMFVWLVFLGVNIGIREGIQMKIDVIDMFIKGVPHKILEILRNVLTIVIVVVCFIGSMTLIKVGMKTLSPTLQFPMYTIYLAFPIGFGLSGLESIRRIILIVSNWNDLPEKAGEK